jgi:hypothetical protein
VVNQIEEYAPGFKKLILHMEIGRRGNWSRRWA